jgi:hypothetical protein
VLRLLASRWVPEDSSEPFTWSLARDRLTPPMTVSAMNSNWSHGVDEVLGTHGRMGISAPTAA